MIRWTRIAKHYGLPIPKLVSSYGPSGAALAVLESVPSREENPFAFPATRGSGPLVGVKLFRRAVERAGLDGVTIHTLRHSYASTALDLGYSELTIAELLGHRLHSATTRYAHHIDRTLVAAADRVAERISAAMAGYMASADVLPLAQARRGDL